MSTTTDNNNNNKNNSFKNRLINEKSPYLLQHAHNPVDWYPWGEEAFKKAKETNKLVFISIGYSSCFWCHVMAHESFENEEIAKVMNELFINIKVDREERPDIDKLYMTYLTEISGSGGWPASIWCTPSLEPITGGTYFAPVPKYGRPSFPDICRKINQAWTTDKIMVQDRANSFLEFLKEERPKGNAENAISEHTIEKCQKKILAQYDEIDGGFSDSPKFPRTSIFNFLHLVGIKDKSGEILKKLHFTLEKMANGGIYDQLGGGFHRYSVTSDWKVPHFEKMLYDQGQIVISYLDAYQSSGSGGSEKNQFFKEIANGILKYVQRDLISKENGGFYSAEDASSLNQQTNKSSEGAFYIWSWDELKSILSSERNEFEIFTYIYEQKENGNVDKHDDPHGELSEKNIIMRYHSNQEAANHFNLPLNEINEIIDGAKSKLYKYRTEKRPRPGLDDKIITSWNALMISAFVKAYQVFGFGEEQENQYSSYLVSAENALQFIKTTLYNPTTKTLTRSFRQGPSKIPGFGDDYAFLIQALLDTYETTFKLEYLLWAIDLQSTLDETFQDKVNGGYFSTDGKDSTLLSRMKEEHDGAEPSMQSITLCNLIRLYNITKHSHYNDSAFSLLSSVSLYLEKAPIIFPQMVVGLSFYLENFNTIIIDSNDSNETKGILKLIHSRYLPNKSILLNSKDKPETLEYFKNSTQNQTFQHSKQIYGQSTVYVCNSNGCLAPVTDLEKLNTLFSNLK